MIRNLERAFEVLARIAQGLAALVLLVLVALTCADVFGRYVLAQPVNGKTELTRMLMAVLIAFVLPVVTARKEHITIDLLDFLFTPRLQRLRDLVIDALAAAGLMVLAWWVGFRALRLMSYGYLSDFLRLPLHPVAFFVAAMIGLAGLALALRMALDAMRPASPKDRTGSAEEPDWE